METLGWRCWFDDGYVHTGTSFENWTNLAKKRPDQCLVKMIYYSDGTKQIQQADWWVEISHPKGIIRRTCLDNKKEEVETENPNAVFIKGFWTTDDWFREVSNAAMRSSW